MEFDVKFYSHLWFLFSLFPFLSAEGQILTVTTHLDQLDSPSGPEFSLREAIRDVNDGGTINFSEYLSGETIVLNPELGSLLVLKSLTIDASSLENGIIIDGNSDLNQERILTIDSMGSVGSNQQVSLRNIIFENGNSNSLEGGGAIFIDGPVFHSLTVSLNHCNFDNNSSSVGGAVSCLSSRDDTLLIIEDCNFTNNRSTRNGGALYAESTSIGRLTVRSSSSHFKRNSSSQSGGAISITSRHRSGTVFFSHDQCSFALNSAAINGGAIYQNGTRGSTLTIVTQCQFSDNSCSRSGGAIYSNHEDGDSSLCLRDSSILRNTAQHGGGISVATNVGNNETSKAHNCTFASNIASQNGGAIYCELNPYPNPEDVNYSLRDSTLVWNTSQTGGAVYCRGQGTLSIASATLTANSAERGGGAFVNSQSSLLNIFNTILAGNMSPSGKDLFENEIIPEQINLILEGKNLFSDLTGSSLVYNNQSDRIILVNDPLLSTLDNYGGFTETMLPLPGSPALDALENIPYQNDQRNRPRDQDGNNDGITGSDIGAAEAPNWENLDRETLETLFSLDPDDDGVSYGVESAIGSNPLVSDLTNFRHLAIFQSNNTNSIISFGKTDEFPSNITLSLLRATNLTSGSFEPLVTFTRNRTTLTDSDDSLSEENALLNFTDTNPPSGSSFYRLEAELSP